MLEQSSRLATQQLTTLECLAARHVSSLRSHEDPRGASIGAGLAVAGAARAAAAQTPPQVTFRAGVDLVDVEVSVLDKNRLPVRGLTANDFTVLEEGSPGRSWRSRPSTCRRGSCRRRRGWNRSLPTCTRTSFAREGRLIVILMDRTIAPERAPGGAADRGSGRQPVARRRHGRCRVVAPRRAAELHRRSATPPGRHPRAGRQSARRRPCAAANAIAAAARWTRLRRSPRPCRTSTGAGSSCCSSAAGFRDAAARGVRGRSTSRRASERCAPPRPAT